MLHTRAGRMTVVGGLTRTDVKNLEMNVTMTTDAHTVLGGIMVFITVEKG